MKPLLAFLLLIGSASFVLSGPLPASRFASSVEAETYPAATAPDRAPTLTWDFASKREVRFKLEQKNDSRFSGLGGTSDSSQESLMSGDLLVKAGGDRTGKLVFDKMTMKTTMTLKGKPGEATQSLPRTVVTGVKEDGSFMTATSGHEALLQILLPLPSKPLAVGDAAELPISIPYSSLGVTGTAKGTTRLRLAGYSTVGKRVCARLEGDISLTKLAVPQDAAGKHEFSGSGKSVLFFDPQRKRLVRGALTLVVRMSVELPAPAATASTGASAEPITMTITSDNMVRLSSGGD